MNISESVKLALDSIAVNKLRAFLTLLSIAIGVFAIIGAGSLVSSINGTVDTELDALGENTFFIYKTPKIQMGDKAWRKYRKRKAITFSQYRELKERLTDVDLVSAQAFSQGFLVKANGKETNPDVTLIGIDEEYYQINNRKISDGRQITFSDIESNRNVAVIGNDIVVKCFPDGKAIGNDITINNQKYNVIGVLDVKGAMFGQSQDNMVLIPLNNFLTYFSDEWSESLTLTIKANKKDDLPVTIDEATGVLRSIRNDKPGEENSFEIESNEAIREQFQSFTIYLYYFGFICGGIALIAAGVGIMNIMLVSVKERTREIGIRKAIGAKRRWIMMQFLIETITLCQVGGAIGILMGVGAGSLFSLLLNLSITLPWNWIIFSLVICTLLGIVFGMYPAGKAAKLDPIEALRYE